LDFLEGFLLGPLWSDTEYENRKHTGFYWFIGLACCSLLIFLFLYPKKAPILLDTSLTGLIALFCLLTIGSPLISHLYYRMVLPVRLAILLLQGLKLSAGMLVLIRLMLPKIGLNTATIGQDALEIVNKIIGTSTDYFTKLAQGTGMLVGIVIGGLGVVLLLALAIVTSLVLPIVWLAALRVIQRVIDLLAINTIIRDYE
jgi:hypothetical protein